MATILILISALVAIGLIWAGFANAMGLPMFDPWSPEMEAAWLRDQHPYLTEEEIEEIIGIKNEI